MPTGELRRNRIDRMIALAQAYRGWTSGELCEALGREPRRAAPGSGNPKLDLIARLADALDWEVGEVAEAPPTAAASFSEMFNNDGPADLAIARKMGQPE